MLLCDKRLGFQRVRMDAYVVGVDLVADEPVEGELSRVAAGERPRHSTTSMSSLPTDASTHARSSATKAMTLVWYLASIASSV